MRFDTAFLGARDADLEIELDEVVNVRIEDDRTTVVLRPFASGY